MNNNKIVIPFINKFDINCHFNFKRIFIISLILKIRKSQKIDWINVDDDKTCQICHIISR